MNNCEITRDLIPLYIDNSCSKDSREFVGQHIAGCEACRSILAASQKAVQTVLTPQKTKESFSQFRRNMRLKKTALIALCTLACLALLTVLLYRPFENYLSGFLPARIEPIEAVVSRLSDDSIHIALQYTEEDVYVNTQRISTHPEDEDTLRIELGYNRLNTWDQRLQNAGAQHLFIVLTEESAPLYKPNSDMPEWNNQPYDKVVLVGSDGERLLWQKGDRLPAADKYAEYNLLDRIECGALVPVK